VDIVGLGVERGDAPVTTWRSYDLVVPAPP
jgi:hypothetical protein